MSLSPLLHLLCSLPRKRWQPPHVQLATGLRFATFLLHGCIPGMESGENLYLLLGSRQTCGGLTLMTPFPTGGRTCFFQPALVPDVSMTNVSFDGGELITGMLCGHLLQYGLTNYQQTTAAGRNMKLNLLQHQPPRQSASLPTLSAVPIRRTSNFVIPHPPQNPQH
jgi:hypothetical protein